MPPCTDLSSKLGEITRNISRLPDEIAKVRSARLCLCRLSWSTKADVLATAVGRHPRSQVETIITDDADRLRHEVERLRRPR